jgi:non-canonical purine NTP pyrophosphatase (RdgB/HAM1 family)
MKIYFVTSNKGKVSSLQSRPPAGYEVEQIEVEVPEIQHSDVEEIVREKVRYAFQKVGKPVVMHDSAFCVPALAGFPGPYVKYSIETIGVEGLLKLMEGKQDRTAYFKMAMAYADESGEVHTFVNDVKSSKGTVADHITEGSTERSWSGIWNIYCPEWGNGKTLAELGPEAIAAHEKKDDTSSEFYHFAQWLKVSGENV